MGGAKGGVEIREKSIRLHFTLEGKRQRPTLMVNGKPMLPTPANIKYANRLIVEIGEKIRTGTFSMAEYFPASGGSSNLTVEGWLNTWIKTQRIEDSTRDGYESAIRFWCAGVCDEAQNPLGAKALRALRLTHFLTVIANRPDLTGKTINNYVIVAKAALDLAVTEKLITSNPAQDIPAAKHQKPPPDPFTRDETDRIIAESARVHEGQVHNLVEFWFWTGLRTSEILGLDWGNVDLASNSILVATALVGGKEKDKTKTAVARTVLLNSRARAALERQRKFTQVAGGFVFQDPRYGKRWAGATPFMRVYWIPILRRLGIRYRRPYNMRHSYATAMLMAGMKPAFCAKQLGHSIEMFLGTYAKWTDGDQNDLEMGRLEAELSPDRPGRNADQS